jgi:hypothetical protein
MSWNINLSGHRDVQNDEAVDELALAVIRLAKKAEVSLTYVNISDGRGSKALFSSAVGIDATSENSDDVAKEEAT